jgi:hypothetical protein
MIVLAVNTNPDTYYTKSKYIVRRALNVHRRGHVEHLNTHTRRYGYMVITLPLPSVYSLPAFARRALPLAGVWPTARESADPSRCGPVPQPNDGVGEASKCISFSGIWRNAVVPLLRRPPSVTTASPL